MGMKYSGKVGIDLFGVKVELGAEITPETKAIAVRSLHVVADHRAFYDAFANETSGGIYSSVKRLRGELVDELKSVPAGSAAAWPLDILASACRRFIGQIDQLAAQGLNNVAGTRTRVESTNTPYDADKSLMAWVKWAGTDDLVRCEKMALSNLTPPIMQWNFIDALSLLRTQGAAAVAALAAIVGEDSVPQDLLALKSRIAT